MKSVKLNSTDYYNQLARCDTYKDIHQLVSELVGLSYEPRIVQKTDKPERKCTVEGCEDKYAAKDLCARHYQQTRQRSKTDPMKRRKRSA